MQKQMDELRQSEKDIAPVLELIAFLREKCASNEPISALLSAWEVCMQNKNLGTHLWRYSGSKDAQYIDIRHTVYGDYEREMFFSIEGVKDLISSGKLRVHREKLSEIAHILHRAEVSFPEKKSKNFVLSDNDPYPPVAVSLPADSYTLELIDGNHRVDLAKRTDTDLSVFVVDNFVVPPQAFLGRKSWATYNILSGVYYLQLPELVRRFRGIYTCQIQEMLWEYHQASGQ